MLKQIITGTFSLMALAALVVGSAAYMFMDTNQRNEKYRYVVRSQNGDYWTNSKPREAGGDCYVETDGSTVKIKGSYVIEEFAGE